jgi:hypothetical protein
MDEVRASNKSEADMNQEEADHQAYDDHQDTDAEYVYELTAQLASADRHCCFMKRRGTAGRNGSQDSFPVLKPTQIRWFSIVWDGHPSEWRIIYDKEPILDVKSHAFAGADKSIYIKDITDVVMESYPMKGFRIYRGKEVIQLISVIDGKARETSELWSAALNAAIQLLQYPDDVTDNLREKWLSATIGAEEDGNEEDVDQVENGNHVPIITEASENQKSELDDHAKAETVSLSSAQSSTQDIATMRFEASSNHQQQAEENQSEEDENQSADNHVDSRAYSRERKDLPSKSSYRNFAMSLLGMVYSNSSKENTPDRDGDTIRERYTRGNNNDSPRKRESPEASPQKVETHQETVGHPSRPLRGILRNSSANSSPEVTKMAEKKEVEGIDTTKSITPLEKWRKETEDLDYNMNPHRDLASRYTTPVIRQLLASQQLMEEKIRSERLAEIDSMTANSLRRSSPYSSSSSPRKHGQPRPEQQVSIISVNGLPKQLASTSSSNRHETTPSTESSSTSDREMILEISQLQVDLFNIRQRLICSLDTSSKSLILQAKDKQKHSIVPLASILAADCASGEYVGFFKLFITHAEPRIDGIGIFTSSHTIWSGWLLFRAVDSTEVKSWLHRLNQERHRSSSS